MATSGTNTFDLDIADVIEEAFDMIGVEPLNGYQLRSARRSLNLMLQEWSNDQINLWKLVETSQTMTQGTVEYTLSAEITDITEVVLSRTSGSTTTDTVMTRLPRYEYMKRPNKATQGRPTQYWVERGQAACVLHVWPAPENSTDVVKFMAMERIEDIGANTNTIDIPVRFLQAATTGLAYRLAIKFAPEKAEGLYKIYQTEIMNARYEDRDRANYKLMVAPSVR